MTTAARSAPVVAAVRWHEQLATPFQHGLLDASGQVAVVHYRDIDHRIDQPPLSENVLSIHLGGPKRVTRWQGRHRSIHDAALNSLTLMPAAQSYRWSTEGPIDFAHIAIGQGLLSQVAIEEHDRHPFDLALLDGVGLVDTLIATFFTALLDDLDRPFTGRLYRQSLLTALSCRLVRDYSTIASSSGRRSRGDAGKTPARGGMAGWQLRRVIDFMHVHMANDIQLMEIIALTGLSRAQFFRAFAQSTGSSPHGFLTELRIQKAAKLLKSTRLPLNTIAARVGLVQTQLYNVFRRRMGLSPSAYRRSVGG